MFFVEWFVVWVLSLVLIGVFCRVFLGRSWSFLPWQILAIDALEHLCVCGLGLGLFLELVNGGVSMMLQVIMGCLVGFGSVLLWIRIGGAFLTPSQNVRGDEARDEEDGPEYPRYMPECGEDAGESGEEAAEWI